MESLYNQWKKEEAEPFEGWDFSHIQGRMREDEPTWDYTGEARRLIRSAQSLLDMGTGGGEIFASLAPLPTHTIATEAYKPNVAVAQSRLEPLGVKVIEADEGLDLPFEDGEFDLVINRQSSFKISELFGILKPRRSFLIATGWRQ